VDESRTISLNNAPPPPPLRGLPLLNNRIVDWRSRLQDPHSLCEGAAVQGRGTGLGATESAVPDFALCRQSSMADI
jgi:hypothetical protein